jgi:hypothetical protein
MRPIMKRFALVTTALLLFAFSGMAQMHLGIRGGIYSTLIAADNIVVNSKKSYFSSDPKMGFHIGLVSQWRYDKVFIQPELLYCSVRGDIMVNKDLTELELKKIDLPVMLGINIRSWKLQAGPVASLLIDDKSFFTDLTKRDLLLNRTYLGFQAGIGVDVSRLTLDLKYEGGITKLDSGISSQTDSFNARLNEIIVFSIGLFFSDR